MTAERRYAEALLDAVWSEPDEARAAVAEELNRLAKAVRDVPDLRNALENPSYSGAERLEVLDAVAERLELSKRVHTFARLIVERGRAAEIGAIAETFERLLNERAGRVKVKVTSATPLDDASKDDIKKALEARTGKTVELELSVDESLIGGVRAEVGSIVYDGTIRAELERLRERLTA
jgi:F-type H+-transporting ATPase subunit delta